MRQLAARDVMNTQVVAVGPDMTTRELAAFLVEKQISGAPVLDAHGKLVGVVSLTDLAEADVQRAEASSSAGLLVRDIMTPTVYAVPEDTPVPLLAQTLISGRIHRLLVTRKHKVVGIVTSLDLLKLLCDDLAYTEAPPAERRRGALARD